MTGVWRLHSSTQQACANPPVGHTVMPLHCLPACPLVDDDPFLVVHFVLTGGDIPSDKLLLCTFLLRWVTLARQWGSWMTLASTCFGASVSWGLVRPVALGIFPILPLEVSLRSFHHLRNFLTDFAPTTTFANQGFQAGLLAPLA